MESCSDTTDNRPSYFAIIPAHVRYCKKLEPAARLLYGEITALANSSGYCWASNKYFAELYDVDERTIRRWLESLSNQEFIYIEIEKVGLKSTRKIWLSKENKEKFTRGQKCPTRSDKNALHNNTSSIDEKKTTDYRAVKYSEPKKIVSSFSSTSKKKKAAIENEQEKRDLLAVFPLLDDQISTLLKLPLENFRDAIELAQQKPPDDLGKFLYNAIKKGWKFTPNAEETLEETNKSYTMNLFNKIVDKLPKNLYVDILNKYVEVGHYGSQSVPIVLEYNTRGFKQKFLDSLEKKGFFCDESRRTG